MDHRTIDIRQAHGNKQSPCMFTASKPVEILSIKQEGQDCIDLTGAEAQVQLATSFISKEQACFNLLNKISFEETSGCQRKLGRPLGHLMS